MAGETFTLVTYNVYNHHEGAGAFEHRAQLLALAIAETEPDIVCLQEVPNREFARQLMAYLSRRQGKAVRVATTEVRRPDGWCEHLALFHPGTGQVALRILSPEGYPVALAVAVQRKSLPGHVPEPPGHEAPPVLVVNAHLDPHSAEKRHEQARGIVGALAYPGPTVVCGDLNAVPGGGTLKLLEEQFTRLAPGHGATFATGLRPELDVSATFDHVLGSGVEVVEQRLVGDEPRGEIWLSDHVGVWARLRVL